MSVMIYYSRENKIKKDVCSLTDNFRDMVHYD